MLMFPGMLVSVAEEAGMKVPPDPDNYDNTEYPHFFVFCCTQLNRAMDPDEPGPNAKVIASLSE